MCKFPLTGCLQNICNFVFEKLVLFVSLCQRLSKKLNFIKIWQVEVDQNKDLVCYRKKQSFWQRDWGLRQLVLKPGFRPKGIEGFGFVGKVRKFQQTNTFELCKKKLKGGQIAPPPAGIGLNTKNELFHLFARVKKAWKTSRA